MVINPQEMLSVKVINAIIQWKLRLYREISLQSVCRRNALGRHGQVTAAVPSSRPAALNFRVTLCTTAKLRRSLAECHYRNFVIRGALKLVAWHNSKG